MAIRRTALAALLAVGLSTAARAESVDLALVLAADVSRSIDGEEFSLQREGYAQAMTDPRVLRAIRSGVAGAIAVCFVEWASPEEQQVVSDWKVIRDGETAEVFAAKLNDAPRSFLGRTSISGAIDFAMAKLASSGFEAKRRIIDISGDGTSNSGGPLDQARARALKAGIVINGLAIINERPNPGALAHTQPPGGLPAYYRENVIGGEGSFLLVVRDFDSFGEAIRNKILTEIAGTPPPGALAATVTAPTRTSP